MMLEVNENVGKKGKGLGDVVELSSNHYRRHQKSIWHKLILLVFRRRRHYQNVSSP